MGKVVVPTKGPPCIVLAIIMVGLMVALVGSASYLIS